jgi:hypothetical protein
MAEHGFVWFSDQCLALSGANFDLGVVWNTQECDEGVVSKQRIEKIQK